MPFLALLNRAAQRSAAGFFMRPFQPPSELGLKRGNKKTRSFAAGLEAERGL
jgi:hypothetical protein